jgi:predicted RNA-binding protein with PUA-like domain
MRQYAAFFLPGAGADGSSIDETPHLSIPPCRAVRCGSTAVSMRYWLIKSEPDAYGIDDLERDGTTPWTGVRNYQARNFMRDLMRPGDRALFYHSNCDEPGIVGIAEVATPPYPDETQFDRRSRYYDEKATRDAPRWVHVDFRFVKKTRLITLDELRSHAGLAGMRVLARGNRLSITPVDPAEWRYIMRLAESSRDDKARRRAK